jgi:hypothetical protein
LFFNTNQTIPINQLCTTSCTTRISQIYLNSDVLREYHINEMLLKSFRKNSSQYNTCVYIIHTNKGSMNRTRPPPCYTYTASRSMPLICYLESKYPSKLSSTYLTPASHFHKGIAGVWPTMGPELRTHLGVPKLTCYVCQFVPKRRQIYGPHDLSGWVVSFHKEQSRYETDTCIYTAVWSHESLTFWISLSAFHANNHYNKED